MKQVIIAALIAGAMAAPVVKSVVKSPGGTVAPSVRIVDGQAANALAWGSYDDATIQTEGWGRLYINTEVGTNEGWWAAGYLEGSFTATRIFEHYTSWYDYTFANGTKPPTEALWQFLDDQYSWAAAEAEEHAAEGCNYWTQVGRILSYSNGIAAGQAAHAPANMALSRAELLMLQAAGDVYDLVPALDASKQLNWNGMTKAQRFDAWHERISCSAMWKVNDALTDVTVSHATWSSYQNLLRVLKHYDLAGHVDVKSGEKGVGHYKVSFSAKPGMIYSKDDFYTLPLAHQQLVVTETTNGVMDNSVYDAVTFKSLLSWQNVPLANSLARSSVEWVDMFAKHASGTYANQWQVGDMKLFVPGKGVQKGFLSIIEVMPGLSHSADVTDVMVSQGNYWPSYNVPYFEDVYAYAGFETAYAQHGDAYSYANCPRAQIFRRDNYTVQSLDDMQRMIRYNDWQNDALSLNDPANAIASRRDLEPNPSSIRAFGALDAKVSSWQLMTKHDGAMVAQSGPTADQQPPFSWSQFPGMQHPGQPETFDFPFVRFDSSPKKQ